jgi:lipid II:glycine glycyltransferase (peptidoglycan interpeptide bridge formation enzyme)
MNLAPIPTWKDLISILLLKRNSESQLASIWSKPDSITGWLSKSSWSLALISLWKYNSFDTKKNAVWYVPDYFCNESLTQLRITNSKIIFYKINEDFSPNIEDCNNLSKDNPPDIFLFVHYFGQYILPIQAKEFCRKNKTWLIEDATHLLLPVRGIGDFGDFLIFSPHKHIPIPNGAILSVNINEKSILNNSEKKIIENPNTWISQLSNDLNLKKIICDINQFESSTWILKRILQKIGFNTSSKIDFDEKININNSKIKSKPKLSFLSKLLLPSLISKINSTSNIKQTNNLIWKFFFSESFDYQDFGILSPDIYYSDNATPYMSIFKINGKCEKVFDKMKADKLPVCSWPDLPPEVFQNKERHKVAIEKRNNYVYLHIHSNLDIYKLLKKSKTAAFTNDDYKINISTSIKDWSKYLCEIEKTNLMQSWKYGDAKSIVENWNVKRYIYTFKNKQIAILQTLEKKYFYFFKVTRINRGPLFFNNTTNFEKKLVIKSVLNQANILQLKLLSFAPNLFFNSNDLYLLLSNNIRLNPFSFSKSIWINLNLSEQELRSKLNGKWRNMLNASEKLKIEFEFGNNKNMVEWILDCHQKNMDNKKFDGVSVSLLKIIGDVDISDAENPLLVFRAVNENQIICALCIYLHGTTATYLLGWNGDLGRKLKANNFLLWNTMLHLKKMGYKCFDLGGIDMINKSGISDFKIGIGGEIYTTLGEIIKY